MEMQPRAKSKLRWGVWLSMATILLMSLMAIFAPVLAPFDPTQIQTRMANYPPAWYNTPPKVGLPEYILGTDFYGRDILSHVIHGTRAAMFLALIAMPLSVLIGVGMGMIAALGNQSVKSFFLWLTDVVSSVPSFMLVVILVFILRGTSTGQVFGGLLTLTFAFALANWVGLARLVYTSVLRIKQQAFMEAARSLGANTARQIVKHILPHMSHLISVWVINNIPAVILMEALLGYVGIQILQVADGTSFQDLSWGGLILFGRTRLNHNPFILLAPTLCILIISMSFSILGGYLNERMNPQLESSDMV
jgi:ABC-type dipeptide/oligopeptide/nickel transport system permease subunit